MQLPPLEIIRSQAPPDDTLLVVRGGERSLEDAVLDRTVGDCWDAHGFFGLSVFADASSGDIVKLAQRTPLARRRLIRTALAGNLRQSGFEVVATFKNPYHFSIVLPDATAATFSELRRRFSEPTLNPGYDPE